MGSKKLIPKTGSIKRDPIRWLCLMAFFLSKRLKRNDLKMEGNQTKDRVSDWAPSTTSLKISGTVSISDINPAPAPV